MGKRERLERESLGFILVRCFRLLVWTITWLSEGSVQVTLRQSREDAFLRRCGLS